MVIFHSYVSLPEGNHYIFWSRSELPWDFPKRRSAEATPSVQPVGAPGQFQATNGRQLRRDLWNKNSPNRISEILSVFGCIWMWSTFQSIYIYIYIQYIYLSMYIYIYLSIYLCVYIYMYIWWNIRDICFYLYMEVSIVMGVRNSWMCFYIYILENPIKKWMI